MAGPAPPDYRPEVRDPWTRWQGASGCGLPHVPPPSTLQSDALGIVLANWPLFLLAASLGLIVNLISLYIIKTSGSTALKVSSYSASPGLSGPHFPFQCEHVCMRPSPVGSEHNIHISVNACPLPAGSERHAWTPGGAVGGDAVQRTCVATGAVWIRHRADRLRLVGP